MPRTDAESLYARAWASRHYRQPLPLLRLLLELLPHTRPVFHRIGRRALASQSPEELARAAREVQQEVDRVLAAKATVRQQMPLLVNYLYPNPA